MQMQSLDSIYRKRRFSPLVIGLVAAVAVAAVVAVILLVRGGTGGGSGETDAAATASDAATNGAARAQAPRAADLPPEAYEEGTLTLDAFHAAMDKAKELDRLGRLYDERAVLLEALAQAGSAYRGALEEELGALSGRIYFTNVPGPDKAEVVVDAPLATIAARHNCPVALIQRMNGISDPDHVQSGRRLVVLDHPKFEVRVSKSRNTLLLTLNGQFFRRYVVATGEGGNTPVGAFRLIERLERPAWETGGRRIPYDGTGENGNILGTHYLKLDVPGYGIHGTWDESTLGRQSSAGCIRMRNADVEDLFVLLPRQTPVVIEP